MSIPYFMDGKAQMKIVKEKKELDKMANTSSCGKKRKKKQTFFSCKSCGNQSASYLKEVIQEGLCLRCRTIKEKERITMPKGKFLCGLDGCTKLVSSAHQECHAHKVHGMSLDNYKQARIDMKKGNRKVEDPRIPTPSNTEELNKKSDEEFKPSLDENKENEPAITFEDVRNAATEADNMFVKEQQDKTPESMPIQKDTEILTKEDTENAAENKLKEIAKTQRTAQNEKYEPKEIIKVVILRCPHCGGALKNEE